MSKYHVVNFTGRIELQDVLNQFAKDGWQLHQIHSSRASDEEINCIGFVVFKFESED
jgi:hypothetical protein